MLHAITPDGAALLEKAVTVFAGSFAPLDADELETFAELLQKLLPEHRVVR